MTYFAIIKKCTGQQQWPMNIGSATFTSIKTVRRLRFYVEIHVEISLSYLIVFCDNLKRYSVSGCHLLTKFGKHQPCCVQFFLKCPQHSINDPLKQQIFKFSFLENYTLGSIFAISQKRKDIFDYISGNYFVVNTRPQNMQILDINI